MLCGDISRNGRSPRQASHQHEVSTDGINTEASEGSRVRYGDATIDSRIAR